MARKTIGIENLRMMINDYLMNTTDGPHGRSERIAYISLIDRVLLDTGNYKGFRYLSEKDLRPGWKPGIRFDENEKPHFDDTDKTRVYYF